MPRIVRSGLVVIESAAALYHSMIFLLIELHLTPGLQETDRIRVMANYVFGASSRLSAQQRSGEILHVMKDNLQLLLNAPEATSRPQVLSNPVPAVNSILSRVEQDSCILVDDPPIWSEWDLQEMLPPPDASNADYIDLWQLTTSDPLKNYLDNSIYR
jgi:hypothetical protein